MTDLAPFADLVTVIKHSGCPCWPCYLMRYDRCELTALKNLGELVTEVEELRTVAAATRRVLRMDPPAPREQG